MVDQGSSAAVSNQTASDQAVSITAESITAESITAESAQWHVRIFDSDRKFLLGSGILLHGKYVITCAGPRP